MFLKSSTLKLKDKHKIQEGTILYSDLNKPAKSFFSKKYMIVGKPDYIIKDKNRIIPVELKFSRHNHPQQNHIYQIAGYCQLVEENFNNFVPYGLIVINNQEQFKIPFNPQMRYELEKTLMEMRNFLISGKILRNHNDFNRCKNCSMKEHCSLQVK